MTGRHVADYERAIAEDAELFGLTPEETDRYAERMRGTFGYQVAVLADARAAFAQAVLSALRL